MSLVTLHTNEEKVCLIGSCMFFFSEKRVIYKYEPLQVITEHSAEESLCVIKLTL